MCPACRGTLDAIVAPVEDLCIKHQIFVEKIRWLEGAALDGGWVTTKNGLTLTLREVEERIEARSKSMSAGRGTL